MRTCSLLESKAPVYSTFFTDRPLGPCSDPLELRCTVSVRTGAAHVASSPSGQPAALAAGDSHAATHFASQQAALPLQLASKMTPLLCNLLPQAALHGIASKPAHAVAYVGAAGATDGAHLEPCVQSACRSSALDVGLAVQSTTCTRLLRTPVCT